MEEDKNYETPEEETNKENSERSAISADLIRGHINTIILRTLYERDKYGYEIIEEIESRSHGQYSMKQPTLYSALKRLESQGYINAYWKNDEVSMGGRRKYFTLTDSGREMAEKNQAEWEYSRTVIDSLISDKNFDFSQPAPATVDFKILKSSTSRVPVVKNKDDEDDDDEEKELREVKFEETVIKTEPLIRETEQITRAAAEETTVTAEPTPSPAEQTEPVRRTENVQEVENPQTVAQPEPVMSEEQRRQLHENYLRLISEPIATREEHEVAEVPCADGIDTDKLIYNNRPETERDYRNLVNGLFVKTIKTQSDGTRNTYEEAQTEVQPAAPTATAIRLDDVNAKADSDGLTVNSSDYAVTGSRRKRYNRGNTMFKCSLIVGIVMLFEFALCLIFKKELGISLAYPFVIFALAFAQVLIFGVLCYTDIGKSSRKPSTLTYLSACIIVTIIIILIICISSLISIDFSSAGDIMAKIVIPCIVALNIPIFAVLFYVFSK